MLTLGLILTFLGGFFLISRISLQFSILERVGYAFPVGIALVTFIMMLADWVGIRLTHNNCLIIASEILVFALLSLFPVRRQFFLNIVSRKRPDLSWINCMWIVLMLLVVYVEYANFEKCMFLPTIDNDSLNGYDTLGWIASREHTYRHMSVFSSDYNPGVHSVASYISYVPMLPLSYTFVYCLGAEMSKVIPALMFLSFLIGFYGTLCRRVGHTASAFALCLLVTAPEMLSFSSLSGNNVTQTVYASAGTIYFALWCADREKRHFLFSMLLLSLSLWVRLEGVCFCFSAGLVVLVMCLRRAVSWKHLLLPISTLLPFVVFELYAVSNGLTSDSAIISHVFWDFDKFYNVSVWTLTLLSTPQYYGYVFFLMLLALFVSILRLRRQRDNLVLLFLFLMGVFLYGVIIYQSNCKWDSLDHIMAYSAKRFYFCFVPMAAFFSVNSHYLRLAFEWIEKKFGAQVIWRK